MSTEPPRQLHEIEHALDTLVDVLTIRFPHVDRTTIDRLVRNTHAELADTATVDAHLIPLTQRLVVEHLRSNDPGQHH